MGWLLLGAILFAGARSRNIPCLYQYFFAQTVYTIVIWPLHWAVGTSSHLYAWAYSILTAFILMSVCRIAIESIQSKQNSWRGAAIAAVVALTLGHFAWTGMPTPIRYYSMIGVIEGTVLLWAGIVVGALAPWAERWGIALTLAVLWVAQTAWRFGFYLHLHDWLRFNWIVSPLLPTVAFAIIGLSLRPVRHRDSLSAIVSRT
jgi:hypothetical protein